MRWKDGKVANVVTWQCGEGGTVATWHGDEVVKCQGSLLRER